MKNELYAIIGIIYAMLLLPITTILGNSLPYWLVVIIYILWMVFTNKIGYSIILVSICLCQPSITSDFLDSDYINEMFSTFFYALLFIPFFISVFLLFVRKCKPYRNVVQISLVFMIIGFLYGLHPSNLVYKIIAVHVAFFIGFYDRLSFESVFRLYSIVVLITTIYAGIEYFVGLSPYSIIYDVFDYSIYDWYVKRASGLLGNPLILLLVAIFYQALICYKGIIKGKLPIIPQLLCLVLSLIVVSRTAVLSCVIFLIMYMIHSTKRHLGKQLLFLVFLVGVFSVVVSCYFSESFDGLIFRLANSNNLHRQSSFQVTYNILADRIFGLGFENFQNLLSKYAASGTNTNVHTLDNMFLTQLAHYGILGFYIIYFYIYYFIQYFKKWNLVKCNKEIFYLSIAFFISAICFDFESYNNICFVVFVLMGSAFYRLDELRYTRLV